MKQISSLLLLFFLLSGSFRAVHAQTVAPGTAGVNEANCDLCGYCKGQAAPANWDKCRSCLYPGAQDASAEESKTLIGLPTPHPDRHYTSLGCVSTDPGIFAGQISTFFFSIVGGIAFLYLLYGAGIIATSGADSERLNHGKRIVWGAITGLLFVLFSVFIIRFIVTSLGVPEFGS